MEKSKSTKISIRNNDLSSALYDFENTAWQKNQLICGIDEVGRGCLSGPIVTVAAIINPYSFHPELKDSKKTTPELRNKLFKWATNSCSYSIGINNNHLIDVQNIYKATQTTMLQSLYSLLYRAKQAPSLILIDAMPLSLKNSGFGSIPTKSLIQGESKSASIAAASIIAKVTRDAIMKKLHKSFPNYKIDKHLGYGTTEHVEAIKKHEASFIHRKSFLKNIKGSHEEQLSLFR
jgi:ribonuclease HII